MLLKGALVGLLLLGAVVLYFWISYWQSFRRFEAVVKRLEQTQKAALEAKPSTQVSHRELQEKEHTIHYFVSGEGKETLVFLHPAFGDHRCFTSQIDAFSKEYKVITLDMLGHGLSQAKETEAHIGMTAQHVIRILDKEGVQKAHLIGVSMGSLMAQYVALRYPKRVQSLTVTGGYNISFENKEVQSRQRREIFQWMLMGLLMPLKVMKSYTAQMTCYHDLQKARFYLYQQPWTRSLFRYMRGLGEVLQPRKEPFTTHPTMLVVGEHDDPLSLKANRDWHKRDPKTTLHIIKNAGHCANMDSPSDFNSTLRTFLQKHALKPSVGDL